MESKEFVVVLHELEAKALANELDSERPEYVDLDSIFQERIEDFYREMVPRETRMAVDAEIQAAGQQPEQTHC